MKKVLIISFMMSMVSAQAQINLPQKAEQKADQVIDDLLFGKKKKKSVTPDSGSTAMPSPSDDYVEVSSDDSDPLEGYVQAEVDFDKMNSSTVVSFRDLINFLPNKVGGYLINQKPEGSTVKYGDMTYSFAQKNYTNGDQELTVGIFDYLTAGGMLAPYTQQYEYESTDGVMTSVRVQDQPGWYSASYSGGESNLVLIVNNRFYVTYSGTDLSKDKMIGWASELNIKRLPSGTPGSQD